MDKNVELLAPAGSYDAFIAAVENGANAVYLGGKLFNARANASNFDLDELKKIVDYAHLRDVKIHLTLNTLLDDNEITKALDYAKDIYNIGVDAVIVQDLGLASLLHKYIPDLPLHASTQLSTHNLEGVNELTKIGFSRVVLARELSIEEIKYICDNTNTEIEIFAHGAQCICYSGECLMSSMIGDRSGNRGKCAQPCRLPYELIKEDSKGIITSCGKGYLLSPKDLSTIDILKDIPNVCCLKIEGRMKSPEYVSTVVSIYRKYLDNLTSIPSSNDKKDLMQIFNRGGFSHAFLEGKIGKDTMCYEKPKNWGLFVGKIISYDNKNTITVSNNGDLDLIVGDGIEVWNNSNDSPSCIISNLEKTSNGYKIGRIHGRINVGDKVYRTSSKILNQKAHESYSRGFVRHKKVDCKITIKEYTPITLTINDFDYVSDIIPEKAINASTPKSKIVEQLRKTGNTPFEINILEIDMDDNIFLPISKINEVRRNAFEEYEKDVLNRYSSRTKISSIEPAIIHQNSDKSPKHVSVFFNYLKEEYLKLKNIDNYYFSFKDALNNLELIKKFSGKKYILFPTITKSNYEKLIKNNIEKISEFVDGFVISNIGQLEYVKNLDKDLVANYTLNTFNSYAVNLLKNIGFKRVIMSPELTKNQINNIKSNIEIETISYGNICVMTSEYCPVGSVAGGFCKNKACSKPCTKKDRYYLKDRMNMNFRVIPDNIDCQSRIFNSKTNSIETKELNIDVIRLDFIDETFEEIQNAIDTHIRGNKLSGENYTNGHFIRPV
ncbi:MAG: U32 family peptidase [Clostridia bacterium]|nr:U32 family peptidase [Clostridia bacterium]